MSGRRCACTANFDELNAAFHRYFDGRAVAVQHELNELFRVGRRSLAIGIPILVGCFVLARLPLDTVLEYPVQRLVEESLLILGWVANWRPLEIFLYDWWPLARRRDLYRRLAAAAVELRPYAERESPGSDGSERDRKGRRRGSRLYRIDNVSVIRIRYIMEYLYLQLDQLFRRIFWQTKPARRLYGRSFGPSNSDRQSLCCRHVRPLQ